MSYRLGIDLGTTYTAAAVWRDGRAHVVDLGTRAPVVPSVVLLRDDGQLIVGEAAERRAATEPERVAREFKRRIGDPTPIMLAGTPVSADALTARLVRWTVDKVAESEGGPAAGIAVSHPANWRDYKQDLLRQVIRQADLDDARTLSEPEAAAIHYASQERTPPGSVVAVYDLGGGTDAGQELTAPELEFLHAARRMCPTVLCVLTRTDFHPHWRTIRDLNAGHLARHGIEAPIVCTAAPLRVAARRTGDRALDDESGFAALEAHLRDGIVADAERLAVRAVSNDVVDVAGHLAAQFQRERQALAATDGREAVAHLGELQARAARLSSSVARWQQTLADGIADLTADLDHELRARLRVAAKEADDAVDAGDPADMWHEFEPWLRRRVSQDVVATYAVLHRRSRQLAARVGEHFDEAGRAVAIRPEVFDPSRLVGDVEADTDIDTATMGRGEAIMTGVRGGYMGVLMFGMLGSMLAGLSMLNPATAVIGMAMGRKSLRQEKDRRLAQRRNSAKIAHRKYADEVAFVVMKDARDTLRRVQRQLRDHYAARAEELQRTTNEALAAAHQAATADTSTRQRRPRDVDAELERIAGLRRTALDLAPDLAGAARA